MPSKKIDEEMLYQPEEFRDFDKERIDKFLIDAGLDPDLCEDDYKFVISLLISNIKQVKEAYQKLIDSLASHFARLGHSKIALDLRKHMKFVEDI